MKKRFLPLLLILALVFTTVPTTSMAGDANPDRGMRFATAQIAEESADITPSKVKLAYGFDGTPYEVIECSPTGYFIIHQESGDFVEYSTTSPSPYQNYEENLYYAGPTYFYVEVDGQLIHTIIDESLTEDAVMALKTASSQLSASFQSGDIATSTSLTSEDSIQIIKVGDVTYIDGYSFFKNLTSGFGYIPHPKQNPKSKGICGYVAANMILQFWQNRGKIRLNYTQDELAAGSLTQALYDINQKEGTWAPDISEAINGYCAANGLPAVAAWGLTTFDVVSEISINRPSILFGYIINEIGTENINHAVVVYGYFTYFNNTNLTTGYVVHYGYDGNYSCVRLRDQLWGSNTCYRMS